MTPAAEEEVFEFKAQTRDLLALVIHSLYTRKDIFLRELVSNASDALDRLRFEAVIAPELAPATQALRITLDADPVRRTLTIADNGIGMTRDDVIQNIGTIARSGTKALLAQIRARSESIPELVGRFGVGFYSAFMVASHVSVVTRHVRETGATRWDSSGEGEYTVSPAERSSSGTSVTLTLKPVDAGSGIEDYTDPWVLTRLVKRYSDFVPYPVVLLNPTSDDLAGEQGQSAVQPPLTEKVLNSQKPVWANSSGTTSEDEYTACYRRLTHDWRAPLLRLAAQAEGGIECQTLLFVPAEAPPDLFYHGSAYGLQMYAMRVLVAEQNPDLLPRYLRFVKGVVDVLDLPLHVSREMLQDRVHIERIRKWITRKVLDLLAATRESDPTLYLSFWRRFGCVLKEGFGVDHDNRDRLLQLFLFPSSHHETDLTSLDDYMARCRPDQQQIFYLTGDSREQIDNAPHVEAVRARGLEVLYLTDPVDELVVQALPEFKGLRLKALDKGTLEIPPSEAAPADSTAASDIAALAAHLETLLAAHVKAVRPSTRLTTSAVCLTRQEYDHSPRLERLLLKAKGSGPRSRPILELNPQHPLIARLNERLASGDDGTPWADCATLLLESALLAEGSEPASYVTFGQALARLMQRSLC